MSLPMIMYFADIVRALTFLLTILALGALILASTLLEHNLVERKKFWFLSLIITFVCLLLIAVFLPSQQGIYLIAGTSKLQDISQTPEAVKARQALDLGLDKVIKKLQDNNK